MENGRTRRGYASPPSAFLCAFALSIGACTPPSQPVGGAPPLASGVRAAPGAPAAADASMALTPVVPGDTVSDAGTGWPYANPATPAPSPHGAVASDSTLATEVGIETLQAGGNAADAAVALGFALAVVYPTAGNLGGGGFAVTHLHGESRALDFRETAPGAATRTMFVDGAGKPTHDSTTGYKAVGVPGSVAGLHEIFRTLGSKKKTWAELLAPAIRLAEEGFQVDAAFLATLDSAGERLKNDPASAAIYFVDGKAPPLGRTFKNPDLARTLKRIAEQGPRGFYEGTVAEAIEGTMKAHGGLVTKPDLRSYRAKWREPIRFAYRGHDVVAMPPPSSGGATLAMICNIVGAYDLAKLGLFSPDELHVVFEAMRRAFAARNARLGDPDFVKNPLGELLAPAWAEKQRQTIEPQKATPSSDIPSAPASAGGPHTTHYAIVDAEGGAVSLTTTLNWYFGTGITVPGTGFVLNNEMDDFTSVPGEANGFGLVQGDANAIAPGKRMLSSMSPTLVLGARPTPDEIRAGQRTSGVDLVLGAAGGPTIITSVFEVLSGVLDFGLSPVVASAAPRFHMQHTPDVVAYEAQGLSHDLEEALRARGYAFAARPHIADVNAIGRVEGGYIPAAEPRRAGSLGRGY